MKIEFIRGILRINEEKQIPQILQVNSEEYNFLPTERKKFDNLRGSIELYNTADSMIFLEFEYTYLEKNEMNVVFENIGPSEHDFEFIKNKSYTGEELKTMSKNQKDLYPQIFYGTGLDMMKSKEELDYKYPSGTLKIKKSIISIYYTSFRDILLGILFISEVIKLNRIDITVEELNEIREKNRLMVDDHLKKRRNNL